MVYLGCFHIFGTVYMHMIFFLVFFIFFYFLFFFFFFFFLSVGGLVGLFIKKERIFFCPGDSPIILFIFWVGVFFISGVLFS